MQTSPLQLGLISALALGLGISLSSPPAIGYPSGPVVSMGSSPIVNVGGERSDPGWFSVVSASSENDLIITDVVFAADISGAGEPKLRLTTGEDIGHYFVFGGSYNSGGVVHLNFKTGIRIPAGAGLEMDTQTTNDINYAFSGYHAHP